MEALATVRKAGRQVHDIRLARSRSSMSSELIADALPAEPDHVRPLAKLVFDRTGGNPFFAIHFITELVEEGLLAFDTDARAGPGTCRGSTPRASPTTSPI